MTLDDIHILERADAILSSAAVWDRAGNRECPGRAVKSSLFCALYQASTEVLGKYDHRRACLEEVRTIIEERGKEYEHRLMGFNNDPSIAFTDLKQVILTAKARVARRIRDGQSSCS